MRIVIVGAGAMGQLFGAMLAADSNDVVLVDTSQNTVDSVTREGITVHFPVSRVQARPTAALATDVHDPADLILVFTKGMHTAGAVDSVRHLIREGTLGLTLQNGLGNEQILLEVFGQQHTLVGITDFPADRLSEHAVRTSDSGRVIIGNTVPGEKISPEARVLADLLDSAGLNARTHRNVYIPIWEKLIFNSVVNTIGGATGITVGQTGAEGSARRLVDAVLAEALTVARARGIDVNRNAIRVSLEATFAEHARHKTSMTADVEAGRRTEIDTIGGAVEQAGREAGVATPVLSALCDVVRLRTSNA